MGMPFWHCSQRYFGCKKTANECIGGIWLDSYALGCSQCLNIEEMLKIQKKLPVPGFLVHPKNTKMHAHFVVAQYLSCSSSQMKHLRTLVVFQVFHYQSGSIQKWNKKFGGIIPLRIKILPTISSAAQVPNEIIAIYWLRLWWDRRQSQAPNKHVVRLILVQWVASHAVKLIFPAKGGINKMSTPSEPPCTTWCSRLRRKNSSLR